MALWTVQTVLAFIFFAIFCNVTKANPIPTDTQATYDVYAELVCETKRLWKWENRLFMDFKSYRFPNTNVVRIVGVPNLRLTEDMDNSRFQEPEIDRLWDHRDYLLHYKYIIDFVLADENNTTSATNFISEITDIRRFILFTIAELENVMIHLGDLSRPQSEIPEGSRPYFIPEWERNVIDRYERDLYVLEQIEMHLTKAVQDFTSLRNGYIGVNTTSMTCPQVLP